MMTCSTLICYVQLFQSALIINDNKAIALLFFPHLLLEKESAN